MKICIKEIYIAWGFSFFAFFAIAQQHKLDSLKRLLPRQQEDSHKVNILVAIANQYIGQYDYENALSFIQLALPLSQKISFKKGEGYCFLKKAVVEFNMNNNTEQAIRDAGRALDLFKQVNFKQGMAEAY